MSDLLKREQIARALFEVGAAPHQFWNDVGLDKRELYLCMADAALSQAAAHAPEALDWSRFNVSVDVSTGDDITAGDRIYGAVIDAQPEADGKVTLLCEYTSDNFAMRTVVARSAAISGGPIASGTIDDWTGGAPDDQLITATAGDLRALIANVATVCAAPTSSPEPDAVRELLEKFAQHADRYAVGAPDTPDEFQVYVSLGWCREARAALSAPVAGADIIEQCAKVASDAAFIARQRIRSARGPKDRTAAVAGESMALNIVEKIRVLSRHQRGTSHPDTSDVDQGRPTRGQGDEWGRHPTDPHYGEPQS